MICKNEIMEKSNMIGLLSRMINSKWNDTYQISPYVSWLFAKVIAECNDLLEWIKNKMVKGPDRELMQDTPITSSKLLKEPKDDIKWPNSIKDQGKQKSNQFHGDGEEWGNENF